MKYKIEMSNGYMIVKMNNENFVLDTGMPLNNFTLDRQKAFNIGGGTYYFDSCPFGFDKEKITKNVGCNISGFLSLGGVLENGFSILKEENGLYLELGVKDNPIGQKIHLYPYSPYLIINEASINNSHRCSRVIIDTGAPIGYVRTNLVSNLPLGNKYEDYNFTEGYFSGYLRDVPIHLGVKFASIKCGVFSDTPRLLPGYNQMGVDGVINIIDFFNKSVTFDLINKNIYIN